MGFICLFIVIIAWIADAIKNAESAKKESIISAKEEIFQLKKETDFDLKERRKEVSRLERRIAQKEETLDAKLESIEKKEAVIAEKNVEIDKVKEEIKKTLDGQLAMLEKIAGLTKEDAKAELVARLDSEMAHETAMKISEYEEKFKEEADTKAKDILSLAKERGIKVQFVSKPALDDLSVTKKHQGIIALTTDFVYSSINDILNLAKSKNEDAFILLLDGVEDPHNLGSILRVAECAGVHGIIIPKDRAVGVNETVVKVSAGASERVKVAKVTNLNRAIEELKQQNIFVYTADMDGDNMYRTNLRGNIALIVFQFLL